jgi:hypothetical protein
MKTKPWAGPEVAKALLQVKTKGRTNKLPCYICGKPINYSLQQGHKTILDGKLGDWACSVQHIRSRNAFPELTWEPSNWAPAHLQCNIEYGTGQASPSLGAVTPLWG